MGYSLCNILTLNTSFNYKIRRFEKLEVNITILPKKNFFEAIVQKD